MKKKFLREPMARAVMLSLALTMAGCGGGGGGVRSDPPPAGQLPTPPDVLPPTSPVEPPVTPTPPVEPPVPPAPAPLLPAGELVMPTRLQEPPMNGAAHLQVINAVSAHLNGNRGNGQFIALYDSGARGGHPALDQHLWWGNGSDLVDWSTNDYKQDDANGHGTSTALVAIGSPQGDWAGGAAPDANLHVMRIIPDRPTDGNPFGQPTVEDGISALERGLASKSAFTRAAGFTWDGNFRWQAPAITQRLFDAFEAYVDWSADSPSYDGLVVFAAGDGGNADPTQMASLPSLPGAPASLSEHWITVAAVETARPDRLAAYSNGCGVAMDYCVVAPGDVTLVGNADTAGNPSYWSMTSTQAASPLVLGAAAMVWQAFPLISGEQVRDILLGTATDLGVPGPDPIFGQGLINVEKALRGPGRLDWGDMDVWLPYGEQMTWWNDISGGGGISTSGDGWLSLSGNNTFTGPLHLTNGSVVTINGRMGADVTIDAGTQLYAWDVTVEGDVENHGNLSINTNNNPKQPTTFKGNVVSDGVLYNGPMPSTTLEGNLELRVPGRYSIYLGNAPLHVKGRANIDGELYVAATAPGYVARSNTEVLVADGGVHGVFSSLHAPMSLMLQATIGYDANRVWLDVTQVQATALSGMNFTPASFSAAQRVDNALDTLNGMAAIPAGAAGYHPVDTFADAAGVLQRIDSRQVLQDSLDSLSGELHGADMTFAMMAIDGNRRKLESRVDELANGRAGVWSDTQQSHRQFGRFSMQSQGWAMGVDVQRDDRFTIGAALSQSDGTGYHAQRRDREQNRQTEGQLYATRGLGRGYLLGAASFGQMQRWTQRDVLIGTNAFRLDSDHTQHYFTAGVQAGLTFSWNTGRATPYAGVQSVQLDRDGFEESGAAGFGLSTADSTLRASQALLGARFDQDVNFGWSAWTLRARIEWQHLLSQVGEDIQARFSAVDAWAPIGGEGLGRDVGVFGLGFDARFGRRGRLGLNLDARREHGETLTGAMATWSVTY
ncbi:S8 family peptidase [Lysobacter sp. A421]